MFFGRIASLVMSYTAIAGALLIFGQSAIGRFGSWSALTFFGSPFTASAEGLLMVSIVLTLAAVVAVFVEIPIVSTYAFWVMVANYIVVVAGIGSSYLILVTKS